MTTFPADVRLRIANPRDRTAVLRLLEGALLDVDSEWVTERLGTDAALVAELRRDTAIGALVRDGPRIRAVAVAPSWRSRGVGRALVARVAATLPAGEDLTAAFDPRVRGFYESLGFSIERQDGRLWGRLPVERAPDPSAATE